MLSSYRALRFVSLLGVIVASCSARAQSVAVGKDAEVEELRQTVRELAVRVSALEEQLRQQRPQRVAAVYPVAGTAGVTLSDVVTGVADEKTEMAEVTVPAAPGVTKQPAELQVATGGDSQSPASQPKLSAPWQLPGGRR